MDFSEKNGYGLERNIGEIIPCGSGDMYDEEEAKLPKVKP
jgi:hypothetical protein